MYEEKTFENILKDMLSMAPADIDTSCGSIYYDAVAPVAMELSKLYAEYSRIFKEAFPDTASEEYLLRHAEELGIVREAATYAVVRGKFNVPIPDGAKFVLGKNTFIRGDHIKTQGGYYYYDLVCEVFGTVGNSPRTGTFIPISYIDGLSYAEATSLITAAQDAEDTEALRLRVCAAASSAAYGGNAADYKRHIKTKHSVGGVKIYPAWNGGGTVKAVIQGADGGVPSTELISEIKTELDPEDGSGTGLGTAPIGHSVTVIGVTAYPIRFETMPTYAAGFTAETARSHIESAVSAYISELASEWESKTALTVRISQIDSAIIGSGCVLDVSGTKIYSSDYDDFISENITLGADDVPVFGEAVLL